MILCIHILSPSLIKENLNFVKSYFSITSGLEIPFIKNLEFFYYEYCLFIAPTHSCFNVVIYNLENRRVNSDQNNRDHSFYLDFCFAFLLSVSLISGVIFFTILSKNINISGATNAICGIKDSMTFTYPCWTNVFAL